MSTYPRVLTVLPALSSDLAIDCIESIDSQFWPDVMVVDNSPDCFAMSLAVRSVDNWGCNIGLPSSWNIAIRAMIAEDYDYLVMLSASTIFDDGMRDLIDALHRAEPEGLLTDAPAWHCVALGRVACARVGLFDENFRPAYSEDADYWWRIYLAGMLDPFMADPFPLAAHSVGQALSIEHGGLVVDHARNNAYYRHKWGGFDGTERFVCPYDDAALDLAQWIPNRASWVCCAPGENPNLPCCLALHHDGPHDDYLGAQWESTAERWGN